jgi:hypothetical protein
MAVPKPVGERLHRRGESLIGGLQVGPLGVAADVGHHVGAQDGHGRGVHRGGHVGMPAGEVAVLPAFHLLAEVRAVSLLVPPGIDGEDLVVAVGRRLVVRVRVGERPELPSEGDLRRVVEMLVPEEDDLVPVQGVLQLPDRFRRQRASDVDAGDVRADMPGHRLDYDHRGFLQCGHAIPFGEMTDSIFRTGGGDCLYCNYFN